MEYVEFAEYQQGLISLKVWIVPPMSGSATEVFHQEMLRYHLKPSYEYQVKSDFIVRVSGKKGIFDLPHKSKEKDII